MTDRQLEERVLRLEQELRRLQRSHAGLEIGAGLNRLGQDTEIHGDLTVTGAIHGGKPNIIQVVRNSQSIPNKSTTAISWSSAEISRYSGSAMWTSGSRIYIRRAGTYQISVVGSFEANTSGGRALGVRVNGSTFILDASRQADQLWGTFISGTILGNFNAGDYIEVTAYQNRGSNLTLTYARAMVVEV